MSVLFDNLEWDYETLEKTWDAIHTIAKDKFKLDYYTPQVEIVSAEQMLDNYSSNAMPFMYHHWSFGKDFIENKRAYDNGHMGLAYEVVINTNPSIAYLMENNTMTMQALVLAHSICGHGSFFKQNHLFREWTDADSILPYLKFAKQYIADCETKYGADAVERLLDACHALKYHGVDKYRRPVELKKEMKEARKRQWLDYVEMEFDPVLDASLYKYKLVSRGRSVEMALKALEKTNLTLPEENILYFIEKYSPSLATWEREIIRIVRKIAQYFHPQMQTKLMNEGWATFIHYHIMEELREQGLITEGQYLEFLNSHTSVANQPDYDSGHYGGFNVYSLGFSIFMDIKRICQEPTEEDKHWFPTIVGTDWLDTVTQVMREYRDESFILQFLSPKVIRDFKLFTILDDVSEDFYNVVFVHDDDDIRNIRQALARQYDLSYLIPNIEIVDCDLENSRELLLVHTVYDGRLLKFREAVKTLDYISELWGFPAFVEYRDPEGNQIDDVDDNV